MSPKNRPVIVQSTSQDLSFAQMSASTTVAELLLKLTEPTMVDEDGTHRAVATAQLTYRLAGQSCGITSPHFLMRAASNQ